MGNDCTSQAVGNLTWEWVFCLVSSYRQLLPNARDQGKKDWLGEVCPRVWLQQPPQGQGPLARTLPLSPLRGLSWPELGPSEGPWFPHFRYSLPPPLGWGMVFLSLLPSSGKWKSCLTLRHRGDCSPPGSSVHGILLARHQGSLWVEMGVNQLNSSYLLSTYYMPGTVLDNGLLELTNRLWH